MQMNLEGFVEQEVLGKGTYGKVYKAKRITDGETYAVKVVNLSALNHREIEDSVNEIRLMASFTSPFIVRFYEAFCDNKRLCIVTEYSRLGDLAHLIDRRKRQNRPLKEEVIWRYFIQLLQGLKVLHSQGVVHRDLKSGNILLSAPDLIKIADLGVSTVLHVRQLARTQIGTPLYLAPEIWKNRPYDQKCDMWSLGVLLYEMMTFTYPFTGRTQRDIAQRTCAGYFPQPRGYSSELTSILRRLLQVNPLLRPSVDELLNTQSVKKRMELISCCLDDNAAEGHDSGRLLSTIKVPRNMRNVNLPNPSYGKKANIVKPLEQRMHLKQGAPLRKQLSQISSPELKMICDRDWWSPNKRPKECLSDSENDDPNTHCVAPCEPRSARPVIQKPMPNLLPKPRRPGMAMVNPRLRHLAFR